MIVLGISMFCLGCVALIVPANDVGIISLNMQFIGTSLTISGAIIFSAGKVINVIQHLSTGKQPATVNEQRGNPIAPVDDTSGKFMLASDYAEREALEVDVVINRIVNGELKGSAINGLWHVEI